jgi:hypothetical protein
MTDTAGRERLREALTIYRRGHDASVTVPECLCVACDWARDALAHDRPSEPSPHGAPFLSVDAVLAHDRPSGSGLRAAYHAGMVVKKAQAVVDMLDAVEVSNPQMLDLIDAVRDHRAALSGSSDPEAVELHDLYSDHEHQLGNCRFCDERRARLNPSGSSDPEAVGLDPLDKFVERAAAKMRERLDHGARKFGALSWREEVYTDEDNHEHIEQALYHLWCAVHDGATEDEWWKRAADVANQAFMLADPARARLNPSASDDGETTDG